MDRLRPAPRRALRLVAVAAVMAFAAAGLTGCGEAPQSPAGPVLVLDVKFGQPFELRTILGATLLFDGREVGRFRQARPESSVVFSRRLEGIAPGQHEVAVRLDEQVESPTPVEHAAVGLATWSGQQLPLADRAGPLAAGGSFRWRLELLPPGQPAPGQTPAATTAAPVN